MMVQRHHWLLKRPTTFYLGVGSFNWINLLVNPQRVTRNPQRATRNPKHATRTAQPATRSSHLFQIFSNDAADLISVSGQNIIGDFFGGAF